MRLVGVLAVAALAGLLPSFAFAQEVAEGERIVTIRDAPLRSGNDTTGTVPMGNILDVKHVNGEWYWVTWTQHKTAKGWINRADVVGFFPALEYFNEEIRRRADGSGVQRAGRGLFREGRSRPGHRRLQPGHQARSETGRGLRQPRPGVGPE